MIPTFSNLRLHNCILFRGCLSRFLHSFFKFFQKQHSRYILDLPLSPTSSQTSVCSRNTSSAPVQTSLSCRRSFGLQDRANLVPEYIFFRSKSIHKTSFEDVTTFLFKGSQCFEAIFLTTRNRNLVVWSSCCFHYEIQLGSELGQLFGTDTFHSNSREIYHRLSQQTRKFQWICTSPMMHINMVTTP